MLRGRCACNAVAYEVSDEFVVAFNCHCSNCRALTGSAFLPWGEIEREKLRVTKGAPSLMLDGDANAHHAALPRVLLAYLLDGTRQQCPRAVWVTRRRTNTQADGVSADDLGIALVPWPVELGDEIAVDGHPWPLEVVDIVWTPPGAKVAAIVTVRAAVLHPV